MTQEKVYNALADYTTMYGMIFFFLKKNSTHIHRRELLTKFVILTLCAGHLYLVCLSVVFSLSAVNVYIQGKTHKSIGELKMKA